MTSFYHAETDMILAAKAKVGSGKSWQNSLFLGGIGNLTYLTVKKKSEFLKNLLKNYCSETL